MKKWLSTILIFSVMLSLVSFSASATTSQDDTAYDLLVSPVPTCSFGENCASAKYNDVKANEWYHEGIDYVLTNNLMVPVAMHSFAPDLNATRSEVITALWEYAGRPVVNYAMLFSDVSQDDDYAEAIRWAASTKIANGYNNTTFGSHDPITREDLATILYRYIQQNGGGFNGLWMFRLDFSDTASISEYAYEAMAWCIMNGLIKGTSETTLNPQANATRAQLATIIQRFATLSENN